MPNIILKNVNSIVLIALLRHYQVKQNLKYIFSILKMLSSIRLKLNVLPSLNYYLNAESEVTVTGVNCHAEFYTPAIINEST